MGIDDTTATSAAIGPRYGALDGLRGVASLYVCVYHVGAVSGYLPFALRHGWRAVIVFFVLSGFVLMLPMARAGGVVVGGLARYGWRRSLRILPPYYAAMAFSAWAAYRVQDLNYRNIVLPIDRATLVSHLGLFHNLDRDWVSKINSAHWSIAFEWQFYFLLPLAFLPIWRRVGSTALCGVLLALSVTPAFFPMEHEFTTSTYAFCMGIAAAGVISRAESGRWLLALLACSVALSLVSRTTFNPTFAVTVALSAVAIVGLCRHPDSIAARALTTRPMRLLGDMSYSLYLTHYPVIALLFPLVRGLRGQPTACLAALAAVAVPACLAFGWLFYVLFERPAVQLLKARGGTASRAKFAAPIARLEPTE